MPYLVIVAPDRPEVFDRVTRMLAADTTLQIFVDRRLAGAEPWHGPERRVNDDLEGTLWVDGYVIVRAR